MKLNERYFHYGRTSRAYSNTSFQIYINPTQAEWKKNIPSEGSLESGVAIQRVKGANYFAIAESYNERFMDKLRETVLNYFNKYKQKDKAGIELIPEKILDVYLGKY